jgi:HSP20 family protein
MASQLPSLFGRRPRSLDFGDAISALQRDIEQVLDDFGRVGLRRGGAGTLTPRLDVTETADELVIEAELPGIDPKDVDVDLEGDVLTISGEKKIDREDKSKGYHMVERAYGSFERSVALPFRADPDQIKATFDKGVLRISMPKPPEAKVEKKKITVAT